jgi:aryl-alcohol dehydrogenase-like predicted oxidoreductase
LASGDIRAHQPRFRGENLTRNLALVEQLRTAAEEMGASVEQVAIAWVLARGEDVVPLVGARRRDQLAEALSAVDVVLSLGQLARIEAAVPVGAVAGDRYAPAQMAGLDSERSTGQWTWRR